MKKYNAKDLTKKDIASALKNLDPADFKEINDLADQISSKMVKKGKLRLSPQKTMFGRISAIELLAKLGILLVEKEVKMVDNEFVKK